VKKIFAITNAWPPNAYGHGLYFRNILKSYSDLTVLGPVGNGIGDSRYVPLLKYEKLKLLPLKFKSVLVQLEMLIKPLYFIGVVKKKPDLTIASQVLYSGLACFLIDLFFDVPYIVVGHGEEFSIFYNSKNKLRFKIAKHVIRHARVIICNSKSTVNILNQFYGVKAGQCEVVYPPIDLTECVVASDDVEQVKTKFNLNDKFVLMAGRLNERRKGFDIGIEAFALVVNEMPDVKLFIAGPGDCSYLDELIIRLKVEKNVKIVGRLKREELMACFILCDVFVMPNRTLQNGDLEGFGIVFLEANSFAKPVIGGKSGGAIEAIEDGVTGFVVDTNDIRHLKDAMVKLLSDSSMRQRMGIDGQERVRRHFNTETTGEAFAKIVMDIE
jgi:glycosyltransferase involved in cell wall biosynthesis